MNADELKVVLDKHSAWIRADGGERANLHGAYLSGADLSYANLSDADLSGACLSGANLSYACLSYACLSGADLRGANLSGANLSYACLSDADLIDANLSDADLRGANLRYANLSYACLSDACLSGANLSYTCLSPNLHIAQRAFCLACPPIGRHGGRIVYRTAQSQHVGSTEYVPGHTYTAPVLSFDCATDCHPGIYAGSLEWMYENYQDVPLVRCYVRDGDWVITAKGAIRCKRIRVLGALA